MIRALTLFGICLLLGGLLAACSFVATPSEMSVPQTIKIRGNQPSDIVITPDGSRVYVTAMGTHNVFVIDTKMNLIADVIDLWEGDFYGAWPFRLAITPDGTKIYVANLMGDNISVINTGINRVVATIDLGHFVHDVAFTPDSRFAYVDLGWNRVPVIDVSTNRVVKTIRLKKRDRTYTLAASHDGRKVYAVTQTGGGRIYVIDVATNRVVDRFELGAEVTNQGMITISPDDSKLYLPSGITSTSYERPDEGVNKVFVIDLATKSVTAEIEIMGGPIAIRLSPNDQLAYVSTFAAQKVFVVDLSNNTVVGEIEWDEVLTGYDEWRRRDLRDMAITPDGGRLYITGWDADAVLVADVTARRMTDAIELNEIMTQLYEIAITPDGKRVYVSSEAAREGARSSLFVIDTSTNSIVEEIVQDSYPSNPCITPNGRLLYAVSGNKVLVIGVATNKVVREISLGDPGGRFFYDIAIVPGQEKAYVTDVRSEYIYVIDLESGTAVDRVNVGWWPQMVVVTPNGTRAYVSRQNNPHDVGGLVVIDTATDQVIGTVAPPTGRGPGGRFDLLATTGDGAYVYWGTSDGVNIVETTSNKVVKVISNSDLATKAQRVLGYPRGIHPSDIAFTSDGSRGYIPCGDAFYVAVLDVATGAIIDRIIDVGIEPVAIVITPNDRFAYVTNKESESVSVIDLATNKVVASISTSK